MDQSAYLFDPTPIGADVLEPLTFDDAFARTVERIPDRVAIVEGELRLAWRELAERVRAFAETLRERGIGGGDVVGLSTPNSVRFVEAHLAIASLGAVTLMLHPAYSREETRSFLERTRAAGLVTAEDVEIIAVPRLRASSKRYARDDKRGPGDPFVLAPTSGTESAVPKICMQSHEGLLSNAAQVARDAAIDERDVFLPASGFTHLFGLLGVHVAIVAGATLVANGKFDAERCAEACARERVSVLWAVPAQCVDLLAVVERREAAPALREARTAGAPLSPALAERMAVAFRVRPRVHWGMSEIGAGIVDGVPLRGAQVRIENGELLYRRADMFRGYLDDPEQTARSITADGFLRTGDLASLDAHGHVAYEGRTKDIINRGGMKVSALELEMHLASVTAIRQLAVVPIPCPRLGERTALVCSLAPGASLSIDDVRAHLDRRGIAKYKWPEYVVVVDALPLTPTGKIAKQAVRTLAAKTLA